MLVGCVIDRYRPGKGGLEAWLSAFFGYLAEQGHEAVLVSGDTAAPSGPFKHESIASRGLTRARRDRRFAERAAELAAGDRFDVTIGFRHVLRCDVYAPHGGTIETTFEAHRRSRRGSVPFSGKWRGFLALERELLTGPEPPARVIAVSEAVRRDLVIRYPGTEGRIRVVPNGIDLERFAPGDGGDGVVLFLAGNPALKGWAAAKEAFRILRRDGIARKLLVAGGDPGDLPAGARYLGRLERPEEVLRAADVLLLPTLHDPFPLVTLEALACGTPVATTEHNGAVDHLGREGPVRVIPHPEDAKALASAAAELMEARPRAEARTMAERFPLEESLGRTLDLLKSVRRTPGGGP